MSACCVIRWRILLNSISNRTGLHNHNFLFMYPKTQLWHFAQWPKENQFNRGKLEVSTTGMQELYKCEWLLQKREHWPWHVSSGFLQRQSLGEMTLTWERWQALSQEHANGVHWKCTTGTSWTWSAMTFHSINYKWKSLWQDSDQLC